jgi:hypothetical protein
LASRLTWVADDRPTAKGWVQELGYRHYYYIQQVWHNPTTGKYAFHSDEYEAWDPDTEPNLGMYDSFAEMLTGVASRYKHLWLK